MAAYLITGSPGVGKSTVTLALKDRGHVAYDSESMIAHLVHKATGVPAEWPKGKVDWGVYDFVWREDGLHELLDSADEVFIGASVGNQEKFYNLFDRIFVLTLDNDELKKRLLSRNKDYGKDPRELAGILKYNTERQARYMETPQAIAIDASRPLDEIVDEIIHLTKTTAR